MTSSEKTASLNTINDYFKDKVKDNGIIQNKYISFDNNTIHFNIYNVFFLYPRSQFSLFSQLLLNEQDIKEF